MEPPSPPDDARQLHALFDAMPQLGWTAGPDGWIDYYNRRWYEYTGTTPESMAGWGWRSVHHPDLLPHVVERWRHSIATGEPFEMAFQLRRHDGAFRWFLTRITPMRDAAGTIVRWVGINTDIDDQKRLEEAAEAANRAKDEFLAMLGHELRNPLAPIVTALKVMELKGSPGTENERAIIARQTKHLARLLDDLLDVSRFLRGRVEMRDEPVAFDAVVAEASEMVAPLVERERHDLAIDVAPGIVTRGDAARLKQVLVNLLANAARYTPAGGHLRLSAAADEGFLVVRVTDDGIGIEPELLPTLFDPFVQKRQSLARSEGGLGLGLAIVRTIVEAHGGSVAARSGGEGRGSEFEVRLPLRTAEPAAEGRAATNPETAPRRILLVDDNRDAADSLAEALGLLGHDVRVAYSGVAAFEAVAGFAPEVALLDLGLPGMDGYELARRLRETARGGEIRLVALTGYGQPSDRERARAAGFARHLVKPVPLDALVAAIAGGDSTT